MNRLFKSALFPILVVLVLAFFALKIVNSSSSGTARHVDDARRRPPSTGKVT